MADAITMVTSGKPVDAETALRLGLVDRLGKDNLLADAEAFALEPSTRGGPVPKLSCGLVAGNSVDWSAEEARIVKRSRRATAPLEGLSALRDSAGLPTPEAFDRERARFLGRTESGFGKAWG